MANRMKLAVAFCLLGVGVGLASVSLAAEPEAEDRAAVAEALENRESYQDEARALQARIDALDDETVAALSEFNTENERLDDLETYNENLRQMLESQAKEKVRLTRELQEIEVVRRELVPLMGEMVETLERFVALDAPMLLAERKARVSRLQDNLVRSDLDLAEKYRRVIEAYQIEAEYGQTLEAYEGTLEREGGDLTVDFLRLGRVALYYVTLDRSQAGLWNAQRGEWELLPDSVLKDLDLALRVARKQAPPNLLPLPLWTPGGES